MPQNPEKVYADTPINKLIAAHNDMRIAIEQAEDDDQIDDLSGTMMALETEIAGRVPPSKQDAISQLQWLVGLPDELSKVRGLTLASLIVWASALA
jgi:hypothetical protein